MTVKETLLLEETIGEAEPRLLVRSRTRLDTGRWWRPTPVWLCVTDEELVLLAVSRRRFAESAPLELCLGSHYCHATGELVIEPVEGLTIGRLRVTPREALALMDVMGVSTAGAVFEDESEQ